MRATLWKVVLILAVIGISFWNLYPLSEKLNLGLDLRGGMHLVLRVETEKIPQEAKKGAVDRG